MELFLPNWKKVPDHRARELFFREIQKGFLLEDMQANQREVAAGRKFEHLRDLWKSQKTRFSAPELAPMATVPAKEYYREIQKHGDGIWHQRDFQKRYIEKNPGLGNKWA